MLAIEEKIKNFVKELGVDIVGIAGPDRLDGPPSLDPAYIMKGAKSVVVTAMPMDVSAIYKFLSKESATYHNVDQKRMDQVMYWNGKKIADFIISQGYRAREVPTNNDYRRSPDIFATHPSFSFRFGAIAAGIAAQGWSGNVMTKEHGAAVYLGAVVTDAELESDEPMDPRYFIDNFCYKCRACAKTCPVSMFEFKEEEYILINDELHPRGKRNNLDLCNISCFGLHALSFEKRWTSWGRYWIDEWVDKQPDLQKFINTRINLMKKGMETGTSYKRYELLRRMAAIRWPEEYYKMLPAGDEAPEDEEELVRIQKEYSNKLGIDGLDDYNVLTCGQCALVCGPTIDENINRLNMLVESGLVIPGENGKMVRVDTFEQAQEIRKKYPQKPGAAQLARDVFKSSNQWPYFYGGIQPKSVFKGIVYDRKLKQAVKEKKKGFKVEV